LLFAAVNLFFSATPVTQELEAVVLSLEISLTLLTLADEVIE